MEIFHGSKEILLAAFESGDLSIELFNFLIDLHIEFANLLSDLTV